MVDSVESLLLLLLLLLVVVVGGVVYGRKITLVLSRTLPCMICMYGSYYLVSVRTAYLIDVYTY